MRGEMVKGYCDPLLYQERSVQEWIDIADALESFRKAIAMGGASSRARSVNAAILAIRSRVEGRSPGERARLRMRERTADLIDQAAARIDDPELERINRKYDRTEAGIMALRGGE